MNNVKNRRKKWKWSEKKNETLEKEEKKEESENVENIANNANNENSQKIDEIRKEIERIKEQQIHERKKKREEKEKKEEEFYLNKTKNVKKEQEISNEDSQIKFFPYTLLIQEILLPKYVDLSKKEVFWFICEENKIKIIW